MAPSPGKVPAPSRNPSLAPWTVQGSDTQSVCPSSKGSAREDSREKAKAGVLPAKDAVSQQPQEALPWNSHGSASCSPCRKLQISVGRKEGEGTLWQGQGTELWLQPPLSSSCPSSMGSHRHRTRKGSEQQLEEVNWQTGDARCVPWDVAVTPCMYLH